MSAAETEAEAKVMLSRAIMIPGVTDFNLSRAGESWVCEVIWLDKSFMSMDQDPLIAVRQAHSAIDRSCRGVISAIASARASCRRTSSEPEPRRQAVRDGNCMRGHQLVAPNLVGAKLRVGQRECLACNRARSYRMTHPETDLQQVADRYFAKIMEAV